MTKTQSTRHRYTGLVNTLYALAVAACFAWAVLLFVDGLERITAACFLLCNLLPLVAYVLDVWHSPKAEQ